MCITCGCDTGKHDHEESHGHGHHDHGHSHHDHYHGHGHDETVMEHGAGQGTRKVAVEADILAKNRHIASGNRLHFRQNGVFAVNLLSSPGSGKTTILERTLRDLWEKTACAVIEGDQQTDNDAVRIAATGVPAVQVNTGAGCHLDAHMICHAAATFDLAAIDLLFIENVGNLVCPASFDLGENHKVVVLSVTEGEDKPLKYPHMFRAADVLLINKTDLLPYLDFNMEKCRDMAGRVNPRLRIIEMSARTGAGMNDWYAWLTEGMTTARLSR